MIHGIRPISLALFQNDNPIVQCKISSINPRSVINYFYLIYFSHVIFDSSFIIHVLLVIIHRLYLNFLPRFVNIHMCFCIRMEPIAISLAFVHKTNPPFKISKCLNTRVYVQVLFKASKLPRQSVVYMIFSNFYSQTYHGATC